MERVCKKSGGRRWAYSKTPEFTPTPSQIRQACREIQARWTPVERARRAMASESPPWMIPIIPLADLPEYLQDLARTDPG